MCYVDLYVILETNHSFADMVMLQTSIVQDFSWNDSNILCSLWL